MPSVKKKATKDTYIDKSGHRRKRLTIKQEKFVNEVVKTGNATEAATKVYKTKNKVVASVIGYENLRKPQIKAEVEDRLQVAKNIIYGLATAGEKEEIRLRAAQDIIDRGEGKAMQRIVQDSNINVNVETATPEELLALIKK